MEIRVEGAEKLDKVGRRLKEIGDKELKRNITRRLKATASPLVPAVKASALERLPKAGGLNEFVGNARVTVTTRLTGDKVGVRLVARVPGHNIGAIDRGRLRHPVFGNREVWVNQEIPAGWFTAPLEASSPAVRGALLAAIEDTARSL